VGQVANLPGFTWQVGNLPHDVCSAMNILVTAGNTLVPIDRVRGITNIFTGRTGAAIALHAHERGHQVTLLTSSPDRANQDAGSAGLQHSHRWQLESFLTFDDLQNLLARRLRQPGLDAVIHCAAVGDYRSAGVFAPMSGTYFDPERLTWEADTGQPALVDRAAGKVKSNEPELWLRLVQTPKLVDRFRSEWGFHRLLVKFKLEVGITEHELVKIAEHSRVQSQADLMVANTLEGAHTWAYLGPLNGGYRRISRRNLPEELLTALENQHKEQTHG
jgi:phosphopantothenoylcysteine synthetase/decarboxylase